MNRFVAAIRKYTSFRGRANRLELNQFLVASMTINAMIIGVSVTLLFIFALGKAMPWDMNFLQVSPIDEIITSIGYVSIIVAIFAAICFLTLLIPFAATVVRRLHDLNRNGAYALALLIPPIGLVMLFALMFVRGGDGPNRFGEARVKAKKPSLPVAGRESDKGRICFKPRSPANPLPDASSLLVFEELSLSKHQATLEEVISATVAFSNPTDASALCEIKVYVNGVVLARQRVDAAPCARGAATIDFPPMRYIGEYAVKAGKLTEKLTVT